MPLRAHYDNIKGVAPQSHPLVLGRRTQRGPSVLPLLPARLQRRSASRTRRYREQHRGRASGRTNKNKFFGVLRSRATGRANLALFQPFAHYFPHCEELRGFLNYFIEYFSVFLASISSTEAQLCYPRTLHDVPKLHTVFAQLLKI